MKVFRKLANDYIFIEAASISNIRAPLKNQEISHAQKNYKHLLHLSLAGESSGNDIMGQLVIGLDHNSLFITDNLIKGSPSEAIAINSKLGWILCGKYKNVSIQQSVINLDFFMFYEFQQNILKIIDLKNSLNREPGC